MHHASHQVTEKPSGYWKQNAQLLIQQAKSMTNAEIARLHHATPRQVSNQLHLLGVPSLIKASEVDARKATLAQQLQTLSIAQIAEQEGRTKSALRQEIAKLGMSAPHPRPRIWDSRKDQLALDAQSMTPQQLADKYGCQISYMRCLLARFGISAVKAAPKPKGPPRNPKPTAPAPLMQACPPRTSIASRSKEPPQIIWPEHVKVQRIPTATPPAHAPIAACTMRQPYRSGQGLTGYQSF